MDNSNPQSGAPHTHDDSDLNVRGIVLSALFLVAAGVFTFIAAHYVIVLLEWTEVKWFDQELTPVVQQAAQDHVAAEAKADRAVSKELESMEQTPEDIKRRRDELHVENAFPEPRLQYNDTSDMNQLNKELDQELNATGKDAEGNIHIPIDQAITKLTERGLPPVTGTFIPVNISPTTVLVPPKAPPKGAAR